MNKRINELLAEGEQVTQELKLYCNEHFGDIGKLRQLRLKAKRVDNELFQEFTSNHKAILGRSSNE